MRAPIQHTQILYQYNNNNSHHHTTTTPLLLPLQIILKTPTRLNITVFDPSLAEAVSKALRDCGQSLNPLVEGNQILVGVPKPSRESRKLTVKNASSLAEKTKQDIRSVRKSGLDKLKKPTVKSHFSEDDIRVVVEVGVIVVIFYDSDYITYTHTIVILYFIITTTI